MYNRISLVRSNIKKDQFHNPMTISSVLDFAIIFVSFASDISLAQNSIHIFIRISFSNGLYTECQIQKRNKSMGIMCVWQMRYSTRMFSCVCVCTELMMMYCLWQPICCVAYQWKADFEIQTLHNDALNSESLSSLDTLIIYGIIQCSHQSHAVR